MDGYTAFIIVSILVNIYIAPSLIAHLTERRHRWPITVINVFLGWTLVGWVVSLSWAVMKDREQQYV